MTHVNRRALMSTHMQVAKVTRRANYVAVLWTAPALVFYIFFALAPMLIALYLSFMQWNGISPATWTGISNWRTLFSDSVTGHALLLTVGMMIGSWLIQTPLSLLLGVFMAGLQRYR